MKRYFGVALVILTGIVASAAMTRAIHAQTAAPIYYVFEADVLNPEPYAKEYVPRAIEIMKAHGGRYAAVGKPISIEGDPPPPRAAVLVFEKRAAFEAWRNSPEFKANREIGVKYARFRSYILEGARP